ncbi:MAG: type I-A CRISPR-associated protein Cas5a [Candidatus Freyarchaeota archaeon]
MLGLKVKAEYHWGFWIRSPGTSKYQSTTPLPPPTTLIGALAYPLVKKGVLKLNGQQIRGEIIKLEKKNILSPAVILEKYVICASAYLDNIAIIWEDLSKYNTILFHETTQSEEDEILAGGRRYTMKYRSGALPVGKVFYPGGVLTVAFLIDKSMGEVVKGNFKNELVKAAWEMTRIGSRESIISVTDVRLYEAKPLKEKKVKTKYYFPAILGSVSEGGHYTEMFWSGGWSREESARFEEYIIPGTKTPISSTLVTVELTTGKAFEVDGEILIASGVG